MRRQIRLLAELLVLSCRRYPAASAAAIAIKVVSLAIVPAIALALRSAVDGASLGDVDRATVAALVAALAIAMLHYLGSIDDTLHFLVMERTALLRIHPDLNRNLVSLEGLDHLERTDLQDRVAVVRWSSWGLMFSAWTALDTLFQAIRVCVLVVLLGTVTPWLMLLAPIAAVPLWLDQRGNGLIAKAETDTAEAFRLQQHLFELATTAGSGKEIRVAGAGPDLARRQARAWREALDGRFRARLRAAGWQITGWVAFTLAFLAGLALVVGQAADGRATAGDVVLTLTVAVSLREVVQTAVGRASQVGHEARLVQPYLWLRDYVAAERAKRTGTRPSPAALREGITLDRVCFTYPGTGRPALHEVSARLPAGTVVAIVGEYGSGKTTLVKLLAKLYQPDSGTIRVDGVDLAELETAGWRARMSAAFQDFGRFRTRFSLTVGLGDLPHQTDRDRVDAAVAAADAQALVARLPDGLDTQLGREMGGVELSEGQWQKTALARASMREAPLLFVLDEPTASLDAPSEHTIFTRYLARARALAERVGAVTVVVSHRFSTVTGADLILVLDQGRVIESGSHAELLAQGGRYAELYGIQATAYALT